jgi:phenylpropionate dioxygenase-like ring-hydroxylating dioxygenase large terminal subunit
MDYGAATGSPQGKEPRMASTTLKGTNGTGARRATWHSKYPELGTAPVAIEPYISSEFFEIERERVFRRTWLCLGREERAPRPGDFFVKDLAIGKTSVVVVRGEDGHLRAFHNACSHRSNKVVWDRHGSAETLTCPFHGWCYRLDGSLLAVPDEKNFFGLDKERLRLTPIALETWEGFIFINLKPEQSLSEYLGEWADGLRGYPFAANGATCYEWSTELRCNWKLLRDAFKEAYHVAFLHRRSARDSYTGPTNPFSHALYFKLFPLHQRWSLPANPAYQPSPLEAAAYRYASFVLKSDFTHKPPAGVNPTGNPSWVLDINAIFPNFTIDMLENGYFTYNFWPIAVDRTLWEVRTYFPRPANAAQRFSQEHARVTFRDLIMEDGSTMERTQSVIASGAKSHFMLQDEELLLRHDNKVLADYIGLRGNGSSVARKRGGNHAPGSAA